MPRVTDKIVKAPGERLRSLRGMGLKLIVGVAALAVGHDTEAQAPDDAKRVSLEARIAALQPLACTPPANPPDLQVAALKSVLDAYAGQYRDVLNEQIAALAAHTAPNLSNDDQDIIRASRGKKLDSLADICGAPAQGLFAPHAAGPPPPLAPPSSLTDKFEVTPGVVRVSENAIEVSEQADTSVTIKNNNNAPVSLGVAQVCLLQDQNGCLPQGEVFHIADGTDKCKKPMAANDQCTLKILFTPHRAYDYNQWLKVPFLDSTGQPAKRGDGSLEPPLMVPLQGQGFVADMARVETNKANANNPSLRSLVGLGIGGATSTDTQQKYFVDFAINAPVWRSGYTVCTNQRGEPLTRRNGEVIARPIANIASVSRKENLVTITTGGLLLLDEGDMVRVAGLFSSFDGDFKVVKVGGVLGTSNFTYEQPGRDENGPPNTGTAQRIQRIIRGARAYDECQELRSPEEKKNHVRYPWSDRNADPLEAPIWWFFNPRITSVPQAPTALSNLNVQGFTDIFSSKQTNLVQGVDVQGGFEFMIVKPRDGRAFFGSFKNTKARLGLAWVVGGGFASPFAAPGTNPTVFTLDPNSPLRHQFQASGAQFCGAPPATSPCDIPSRFTNITFVNQERSRFFRKYYTGLRLKTYNFSKAFSSHDCNPGYKNECEGVYNAYPGILDLTVAQDEQVTGGHLSGWLFRLDVAYPLPFLPGTYAFGGVNSAFKKNQNSDPVFLPPTSNTPISDPSVFQVKVPLRDRDNYSLGIGVDLLQVITQAKQGSNKNPAGAGTTPAPGTTADSAKPN